MAVLARFIVVFSISIFCPWPLFAKDYFYSSMKEKDGSFSNWSIIYSDESKEVTFGDTSSKMDNRQCENIGAKGNCVSYGTLVLFQPQSSRGQGKSGNGELSYVWQVVESNDGRSMKVSVKIGDDETIAFYNLRNELVYFRFSDKKVDVSYVCVSADCLNLSKMM